MHLILKKAATVSLYTCEAEFHAMTMGTKKTFRILRVNEIRLGI